MLRGLRLVRYINERYGFLTHIIEFDVTMCSCTRVLSHVFLFVKYKILKHSVAHALGPINIMIDKDIFKVGQGFD